MTVYLIFGPRQRVAGDQGFTDTWVRTLAAGRGWHRGARRQNVMETGGKGL